MHDFTVLLYFGAGENEGVVNLPGMPCTTLERVWPGGASGSLGLPDAMRRYHCAVWRYLWAGPRFAFFACDGDVPICDLFFMIYCCEIRESLFSRFGSLAPEGVGLVSFSVLLI